VLTENGSDAYSITIDKGSSGSAAYFTLELNVISKDENGQQMNEMTIPIYSRSDFFNNNDPIHYSVADPSFVYPESQLGPQGTSWSEQRYFRARGIGNRQFSFQLIKRARHLPELEKTTNDEGKQTNDHYLHLTPIFNDEDIHHVEYSNLAEAPPFTPFTGNGDENTTFQGISYSPLPDTTNRTPPVYVPSIVDCNGNTLDANGNIISTPEDEETVEAAEELESEAMEDRRYYSTASNLKNYPLCEPSSQDTCLAAENKPLYIDSETCNKYNEIDRYIELMKVQIGEAREIRKRGYDLLKSNNISYSFNNGTNENEFDENQTPQEMSDILLIQITNTNIDDIFNSTDLNEIELGINTLTELHDTFSNLKDELIDHFYHEEKYGFENLYINKHESGMNLLSYEVLKEIDQIPVELTDTCKTMRSELRLEYLINRLYVEKITNSLDNKLKKERERFGVISGKQNYESNRLTKCLEQQRQGGNNFCQQSDFECNWQYVDSDGNNKTIDDYRRCSENVYRIKEQINDDCRIMQICGVDIYKRSIKNDNKYAIMESCQFVVNYTDTEETGVKRYRMLGTINKNEVNEDGINKALECSSNAAKVFNENDRSLPLNNRFDGNSFNYFNFDNPPSYPGSYYYPNKNMLMYDSDRIGGLIINNGEPDQFYNRYSPTVRSGYADNYVFPLDDFYIDFKNINDIKLKFHIPTDYGELINYQYWKLHYVVIKQSDYLKLLDTERIKEHRPSNPWAKDHFILTSNMNNSDIFHDLAWKGDATEGIITKGTSALNPFKVDRDIVDLLEIDIVSPNSDKQFEENEDYKLIFMIHDQSFSSRGQGTQYSNNFIINFSTKPQPPNNQQTQ
jgi:hypothetical protein